MKAPWWFVGAAALSCDLETDPTRVAPLRPTQYCPGVELHPTGTLTCRDDSQCDPAQHCERASTATSGLRLQGARQPGVPTRPECNVGPEPCTEDDDCPTGQVCDERPRLPQCGPLLAQGCFPKCVASQCPSKPGAFAAYPEACGPDDGHCQLLPCDGPNGAACGAGFVCDPTADVTREDGCAPVSCAAGHACPMPNTKCAAERVERWTPGFELDGFAVDAHGCVEVSCTEGRACAVVVWNGRSVQGRCAPDAPGADHYGCAPPSCTDDPSLCLAHSVCSPDASTADAFGCVVVPCRSGLACPAGTLCLPNDPDADDGGCAPSPPGCRFDTDCDCGSCVLGRCSDRPGVCVAD